MPAQLSTQLTDLCFGTYGWEWPQWVSDYYPDDLPLDWRAGYYANEAPCVGLPAAQWLAAPARRIAAWREDLPDEFRFFLELEDGPLESEELAARIDLLGPGVAAVLCASAAQTRQLADILAERPIPALAPRPVQSPAAITGLWAGVDPVAGLRVVRLEIDAARRRAWPELLTGLHGCLSDATAAAVFLSGPGVTPAVAREFRSTAELMGLA